MYAGYIPGIGFAVPGEKGETGAAGSTGAAGANGFVVLGTGTHTSGDTLSVSLSEALTENRSVLVVADIELASATLPDFSLYPSGATQGNFSYRITGASAGTGVNPRVARVASSGAIGMRIQLSGVLTLNEAQKLSYHGHFTNSTLAQYGQAYFYETTGTRTSISTLILETTVSGAMAAGSKISIFKLW